MSPTRKKVIFDTDPGIDDAMALLYLNACPDLDLLGITTILGNASIDQCTMNALFLKEKFKINAPIYRGASAGFNGETPIDYPDFVHGKDGLGDVVNIRTHGQVERQVAADFLIDAVNQAPGEVTIIAVGRLTNIALAITGSTSFATDVKNIVLMGGAYQCEGNVTPFAEANIIGDPEAANIVFTSQIPTTMVGLDVTQQTMMSQHYLQTLGGQLGPIGEFIIDINRVYASFYEQAHGWESFPVHDSSAVAYVDQPEMFTALTGRLNCVLTGEERGRTVFKPDNAANHQVCINVESEKMLARYQQIVTSHYPPS